MIPTITKPWVFGAKKFYFQRVTGNMQWFLWGAIFGMGPGAFVSYRLGPLNLRVELWRRR